MKLFHSPTSPFVRKVLVALIETGQRDDVELVPVAVSPVNPGDVVPASNPLGKIPALMLDNGKTLFDSRVICRYIDTLHSATKLYPEGDDLWDVLTLEAMADGINDASILMAYERILRAEDMRSDDWLEAQWGKVTRALNDIENNKMAQLNTLTMASIAVATSLGYLDLRHSERNWREGRPNLAAWEAEINLRPSFAETVPKLPN